MDNSIPTAPNPTDDGTMSITFLGAAGTVTGSKFLVHHDGKRVLIDCGMFQGMKQHRLMNWEPLPIDAKDIDAVILTHAHLDHSGYLPVLVRKGFHGPVYCTQPTAELTKILLMDAAKIQEEDAEYANRKGFSKHAPALPLFDSHDVDNLLPHLKPVALHSAFSLGEMKFEFAMMGHILGAASVQISVNEQKILFSGDIGRYNDHLMTDPEPPTAPDVIVLESTYGDRLHSEIPARETLKSLIQEVWHKRSVLLIPSFALGRVQTLILELHRMLLTNEIPRIPIYVNSPMAYEVTKLYSEHPDYLRLQANEMEEASQCCKWIRTAAESRHLNEQHGPMVIIAASGMLTGGRVLHHMKAFADDPDNIILLAGFQAAGTRGWSLKNGAKEVKIHGSMVPIRAKVIASESFSAHADQQEILKWLEQSKRKPKNCFIVHGEPTASDELRKQIESRFKIRSVVPLMNQMIRLL